MTFQETFAETEDCDEAPDMETIVLDCYYCGRTFDSGLTDPTRIDREPWCEVCTGE